MGQPNYIKTASGGEDEDDVRVRTYPKRYLVLFVVLYHVALTSFQSIEYNSVSDVIAIHYGVSPVLVTLTGAIFGLNYVIFFHLINSFLEVCGLRKSLIFAGFLHFAGLLVKCVDFGPFTFSAILVAQFIVSLTYLMMVIMFSTVTAVWFGAKEVATTKALIGACFPLGMGFGFLMRAMVKLENVGDSLHGVSVTTAISSLLILFLTVLFVDEKPPSPPSYAEKHKTTELDWSTLFTNVNYLLLLVGYAIFGVVSITLLVVLNEAILSIYPNGNQVVALTGFLLTFPGVFAPIFGYWLDKGKNFRLWALSTSIFILVSISLLWASFRFQSTSLTYFSSLCLGFGFTAFMLVAPDVVVEITYPFSESRATGFLQLPLQLLSFFVPPIFSYLIEVLGASWCTLIQLGLIALGSVGIFLIKWELRRQNVENSAPLMMPSDETSADHHPFLRDDRGKLPMSIVIIPRRNSAPATVKYATQERIGLIN